jgi:hypothetical protein
MCPMRRFGDMVSRRVRFGVICCGLIAAALALFYAWIERDNPKFINYAVAFVPVALSILVAFVPDLRRAHMAWRVGIIATGAIWSLLLLQQQLQSAGEQEKAIASALKEANDHSDKQLGERLSSLPSDVADAVSLKLAPTKTEGTTTIPSNEKLPAAPSTPNSKLHTSSSAHNGVAPKSNLESDVQDIKKLLTDKTKWRLDSEQQSILAHQMAPFATKDDRGNLIFCVLGDSDSTNFAMDLVKVFRAAGWTLPGAGFNQAVYMGSPVGIRIQLSSRIAQPPGLAQFVATLRGFGIEPTGEIDEKVPANEFRIIVGRKPS